MTDPNPDPPEVVASSDDHVTEIRLNRPPNNFFSIEMVEGVADALEAADADDRCRAVVLASEGKHFCAGADFSGGGRDYTTEHLYDTAVRMFRTRKPIVAAVDGAAVGGGLGLALVADFRIACPEARFWANFARLGFHQGFATSVTLPRVVGAQHAAKMLYTGRRVTGEEAGGIGLADEVVARAAVGPRAHQLAAEIAASAPLAVESIRATIRGDLADRVVDAVVHERLEQERLASTDDYREGTRAVLERRPARFTRR